MHTVVYMLRQLRARLKMLIAICELKQNLMLFLNLIIIDRFILLQIVYNCKCSMYSHLTLMAYIHLVYIFKCIVETNIDVHTGIVLLNR